MFVELVTNNLSVDIWFILMFICHDAVMLQLESKNNFATLMFVWEMQLSDSG